MFQFSFALGAHIHNVYKMYIIVLVEHMELIECLARRLRKLMVRVRRMLLPSNAMHKL